MVETPSGRAFAPPNKKLADGHIAQVEFEPIDESEEKCQTESYLNVTNQAVSDISSEPNGNVCYAIKQTDQDIANRYSYLSVINIVTFQQTLTFLIDTGAPISVNKNIFNDEQFFEKIISLETAGGQIKASKFVQVPLFYPYNNTKISFVVCPDKLPFTGIIGTDIINKLQMHLDLPNSLLVVPGVTHKIINIPSRSCNTVTTRDERMTSKGKNKPFSNRQFLRK